MSYNKAKSNKTNKVTPQDFSVKNFKVPREIVEKQQYGKSQNTKTENKMISNQYTTFPKYVYSQSSGDNNSKVDVNEDTFGLLTGVFEMKRGGLLSVDGTYRKSDDDCTAFWLPLEECNGGEAATELKTMVFEQIDKYYGEKIKSAPSDFLFVKNGKQETPIEDLLYTPLVRKSPKPSGAGKDFVPWLRTKVRIPFKDIEEDGVKRREIDVKLIINDDDGEQEKKIVKSITELRKDFTYGCKVQFFLEIKTFWALKSAKTQGDAEYRDCGFKVTCKMINIVERSKMARPKDYDWDDILGCGDDEDDGFAKPQQKSNKLTQKEEPKKEVKKESKKESDSSSSDSDDDDDNDKQKVEEKKEDKKQETSSSSSDSDSEDEKTKVAKAKPQAKKVKGKK